MILQLEHFISEAELRAALAPVFAALRDNAALVFPTETIYGIGARALNDEALQAVFDAKNRAAEKAPPVLISSREQLQLLVKTVPPAAQTLMDAHWPGALTLVLPAQGDLPPHLTQLNSRGAKTIAVRQTSQRIARLLCEEIGPMIATSANFSGAIGSAAAPRTLEDVDSELRSRVAFSLDDGEVFGAPSSVVDCSENAPRLLREGALSATSLGIEI